MLDTINSNPRLSVRLPNQSLKVRTDATSRKGGVSSHYSRNQHRAVSSRHSRPRQTLSKALRRPREPKCQLARQTVEAATTSTKKANADLPLTVALRHKDLDKCDARSAPLARSPPIWVGNTALSNAGLRRCPNALKNTLAVWLTRPTPLFSADPLVLGTVTSRHPLHACGSSVCVEILANIGSRRRALQKLNWNHVATNTLCSNQLARWQLQCPLSTVSTQLPNTESSPLQALRHSHALNRRCPKPDLPVAQRKNATTHLLLHVHTLLRYHLEKSRFSMVPASSSSRIWQIRRPP